MGKASERMRYYPAFGLKSGLIALIRRFLFAWNRDSATSRSNWSNFRQSTFKLFANF